LAGRLELEKGTRKAIGHMSLWQLLRNKYFLVMAVVASGASAAGTSLSIWQPQLLKTFGLTNLQTGFVNSIPYGIACIAMIYWGRHSDRTQERRWHTAIALLFIAGGLGSISFMPHVVAPIVFCLSLALMGAYSFKGPFWALSSGWLSASTAAAGLAGINAFANLVGGGMISLIGVIKEETGSFALSLLPLVALTTIGAVLVLYVSRSEASSAPAAAAA
jgi:nitrate/nitrite transporter NarK